MAMLVIYVLVVCVFLLVCQWRQARKLVACVLAYSCTTQAQVVDFIAIDSPPFAYLNGDAAAGINIEWLENVRTQLPYSSQVLVYPLKRAMHRVEHDASSILFGIARTQKGRQILIGSRQCLMLISAMSGLKQAIRRPMFTVLSIVFTPARQWKPY